MKKALPSLFFLLMVVLSGCNPANDDTSSSNDLDDFIFCEDDSEYFVFEKSNSLKNVISELPLGALTSSNLNLLLNSLKLNDSEANKVEVTLERKVDYNVLNVFDHKKDKEETYLKEFYRYGDLKMLVGTYEETIKTYDEVNDQTNLLERDAIFQSYRNGFCPSLSRYFDVYDFGDNASDYAKEYIYSTEDYLGKLNLVDGDYLAKDLLDKKKMFEDSNVFSNLTLGAIKSATETEITLSGSYAPANGATGEKVIYKVVIQDGMITKIRNFKGTFEIDGGNEVFRTQESLIKEFSTVDLDVFDGEQLEIDDEFEGTQPLIDYIDIFL